MNWWDLMPIYQYNTDAASDYINLYTDGDNRSSVEKLMDWSFLSKMLQDPRYRQLSEPVVKKPSSRDKAIVSDMQKAFPNYRDRKNIYNAVGDYKEQQEAPFYANRGIRWKPRESWRPYLIGGATPYSELAMRMTNVSPAWQDERINSQYGIPLPANYELGRLLDLWKQTGASYVSDITSAYNDAKELAKYSNGYNRIEDQLGRSSTTSPFSINERVIKDSKTNKVVDTQYLMNGPFPQVIYDNARFVVGHPYGSSAILDELPHVIQGGKGSMSHNPDDQKLVHQFFDNKVKEMHTQTGDDIDYMTPGNTEHMAHGIIQPELLRWLRDPAGSSVDDLLRNAYNLQEKYKYRDPDNRDLNKYTKYKDGKDNVDAYGKFQQTPVGALLPFKYGKDSGIHIKPSHRGRFTQYLKSHPGMTAEKAKHSKSATVRKMATFALNARKWKH